MLNSYDTLAAAAATVAMSVCIHAILFWILHAQMNSCSLEGQRQCQDIRVLANEFLLSIL